MKEKKRNFRFVQMKTVLIVFRQRKNTKENKRIFLLKRKLYAAWMNFRLIKIGKRNVYSLSKEMIKIIFSQLKAEKEKPFKNKWKKLFPSIQKNLKDRHSPDHHIIFMIIKLLNTKMPI